jgi:hypothetical protein
MARKTVLQFFKETLTVVGAKIPARHLHNMQMVINYMKIGRWMAAHGFHAKARVRDRSEVFAAVVKQVQNKQVLYMEFGVFQGASMMYWSGALKHPHALLHGFDSFEGLPEDFDIDGPIVRSTHDLKGQMPQIDDPRVKFFKGWFDQTLPTYTVPEHEVLVIMIDADLYSSTIYVLRHLREFMKPGTFIYFDDMSRPEHEPRAFDEFMTESGLRFQLVSAECTLNRSFFECVG